MVHLYNFHTQTEDIEKSYSIESLKIHLDFIERDYAALAALSIAVRTRLAELDKIEFFQVVKISQSTDYTHGSRIVFYVARELYARENGQEIYVSSTDNKRFFWREKKDAFAYAEELSKTHSLPIRDLTKKKEKGGAGE